LIVGDNTNNGFETPTMASNFLKQSFTTPPILFSVV
jgi:hypothetical protein